MEQLGIEPLQLITQIINFSILLFLLNKFLYKPVRKALEDRREKIEKGLEYSEKMKSELENSEAKREEIIRKAKDEAKKIVEEGKKNGKQVEADIIEKAHKEATLIISKAREEIELERQEMERQLKVEAVEIAQKWVESILGKSLDISTQTAIINRKIRNLAKIDLNVNRN